LNLRHTDPESDALSELSYGGMNVLKTRRLTHRCKRS
jgi:hypothetical protein